MNSSFANMQEKMVANAQSLQAVMAPKGSAIAATLSSINPGGLSSLT